MDINNVYCKNCGSDVVAEDYKKELKKMLIDEVKLCICSDCGFDNHVQKDTDYTFHHLYFSVKIIC